MALDFSKPLRTKETHLRVVYLGATNCGEWFAEREANGWEARWCLPYNVSEFYENVPERRTLDCWISALQTPSNGCVGVLWDNEERAKEWIVCHPDKIRGCIKQVSIGYEVGEGL